MSTFQVLVTAAAFRESGAAAEAPLTEAGLIVCYPPRMGPLPAEELVPHLRAADAVIAGSDPYTQRVLRDCPLLRLIARWGTGYDSVDVPACSNHGVMVCNAPGLNVEAVADYTLGAMLALARRLPYQLAVMAAGGWEEVRGVELFRKTVGIVGCGAIGTAVARRLAGFQCRLLGYDPHALPGALAAAGIEAVTLQQLCSQADFITVHAALTASTRALIGEPEFRAMKPTAYLVNAARGPIVEEAALLAALVEGRLAGAALDAYVTEPLPPDHPLRRLPNVLATPHSAFNTWETARAINALVARQILAAYRGLEPPHLLNPEALTRRRG